ncbi:MAG: D-galactonate dehydratase [Phycisphaeraceae bacterium]|nr:D-galactonate dehydratase [Phycisphaeraceae bacterium]
MKITDIKTFKFSVPTGQDVRDPATGHLICSTSKPWLFAKIETDAGISGWGEGTGEWLVPSVEATLHEWKGLLIGRDPLPVAALSEDITNRIPWKGGPVFGTALAAINMALYDIAGKAWSVPVHTILGGARRERVRVYSNGGAYGAPETAVESARAAAQRGYAGIKGNPLETRTWPMDCEAVDLTVACIRAVREEVGPEFDILLDAHGSPTPELSISLARDAAPYRPLFIEEPVKVGSVDALAAVTRQSPVPVATGEKLFTPGDFKPLIDARACAILQPDVTHCFGITTLVEIARMAERQQMMMAPHNACGPIGHAASLQADAVMSNFLIQETCADWFEIFDRYVDHDWVVQGGYTNVSRRPGLGLEVKEVDIASLKYEPMPYREYRHADGSWKGW